jgi:hypothetical protein
MGNIVAGSAFKRGMAAPNYALLNAAVPAICYDNNPDLIQTSWGYTTPNDDSDLATKALAYAGQLGTLNTNAVNFYLSADSALAKWEENNDTPGPAGRFLGPIELWIGSKPQRYNVFTTGYGYDRTAPSGKRLYITFFTAFGRYMIDPHEAMAYAVQSPTKTVGAESRTAGAIGDSDDLNGYGFNDEHSAAFNRSVQQTMPFYEHLMVKLGIPLP